jgi:hypothetical protein
MSFVRGTVHAQAEFLSDQGAIKIVDYAVQRYANKRKHLSSYVDFLRQNFLPTPPGFFPSRCPFSNSRDPFSVGTDEDVRSEDVPTWSQENLRQGARFFRLHVHLVIVEVAFFEGRGPWAS